MWRTCLHVNCFLHKTCGLLRILYWVVDRDHNREGAVLCWEIQHFNRYMLAVPIQCLAFMCYVLFKAVRCSWLNSCYVLLELWWALLPDPRPWNRCEKMNWDNEMSAAGHSWFEPCLESQHKHIYIYYDDPAEKYCLSTLGLKLGQWDEHSWS